ncbi:nicotinate mononucleotide-dependent phosphoribosyltransferase CobT [Argonema antarcticum]|uniref:nicotinate mononucleotide-dependent phosphoribosyltransferase CobT n=1 Tax=Argonema antarcticum TaxID=2942763 RepID=UPI0020139B7E|nr:TIGR00303 family protein [Argonema antarcticum]MCL1471037.1 TIGR00303 family protein [Argonema antarcticum A004/B2]
MIKIYTQVEKGNEWLRQYRGRQPVFACVLGFTETGSIPGISAAGRTPLDRQFTALADAEFLYSGPVSKPKYPLPPLHEGASPVLISRAVVEALSLPLYLFNAGLPQPPSVPTIDLGGRAARCLSSGKALRLETVRHLWEEGLIWGEKLAAVSDSGFIVLGECVVGGTTTALAVLTGLGVPAAGKVNSSHPTCNHDQKWALVQAGLESARLGSVGDWQSDAQTEIPNPKSKIQNPKSIDPLQVVAAVGDPMQVAVAGMAIAASRTCGVMLAGGTQMLAVYALIQAIAKEYSLVWEPEQIVVGTTRWVVEDPSGDTVGLAQIVGSVPLLATQLSFATSRYGKLQAYEQGYVKEGMGAGACAIAAHLYAGWKQTELLQAIEALVERYCA